MALSNVKLAICEYDFAVDGGLVSVITLADTEFIPAGAVITSLTGNISTSLAGAGAKLEILIGGDQISGTALAITGLVAPRNIPFTIGSSSLSPGGYVQLEITVAALTAGKFKLFVEYAY